MAQDVSFIDVSEILKFGRCREGEKAKPHNATTTMTTLRTSRFSTQPVQSNPRDGVNRTSLTPAPPRREPPVPGPSPPQSSSSVESALMDMSSWAPVMRSYRDSTSLAAVSKCEVAS